MRMPLVVFLAVLQLCPLFKAAYLGLPAGAEVLGGPDDCRCVPRQWEGTLLSTEREFQLVGGGQAFRGQSSVTVHYDLDHQLLATRELETGMKSIEDYKKGLKYTFDGIGHCRVTTIQGATMEKMCIPDRAVAVSEFRLGADGRPVAVWQWTNEADDNDANYTRTTLVDMNHCFPISEETYISTDEFAEMVTYLYANISLGIKDPDVFRPDISCIRKADDVELDLRQRIQRNSYVPYK